MAEGKFERRASGIESSKITTQNQPTSKDSNQLLISSSLDIHSNNATNATTSIHLRVAHVEVARIGLKNARLFLVGSEEGEANSDRISTWNVVVVGISIFVVVIQLGGRNFGVIGFGESFRQVNLSEKK